MSGGGLFIDADGYFYSPDAAAQHAIVVQGGYTTPEREAKRMIAEGGRHAEIAREWLAKKAPARIDRYIVNDILTELAARFNVRLDDETLNELTHHVADILEGNAS